MLKKNSNVGRRAWSILRLALLWARKGGVFKKHLMMDLRLNVPKFLKNMGHTTPKGQQLHYFERELSFDKTPIIHVKMHRPGHSMRFINIPCINPPQGDFDSDDDDESISIGCGLNGFYDDYCGNGRRKSFLKGVDDEEEDEMEGNHLGMEEEGKEIDLRAEEFIANFYQQMKLQRQISYLEYNERPNHHH